MEVEEGASHRNGGGLSFSVLGGHVQLPGAAPGVHKQGLAVIPVQSGLLQLVQNGVAETIDLIETQLAVHRQVTGDLGKLRLSLALPALGRLLGLQPPAQGAGEHRAQDGQAQERGVQDPEADPLLFRPGFHIRNPPV